MKRVQPVSQNDCSTSGAVYTKTSVGQSPIFALTKVYLSEDICPIIIYCDLGVTIIGQLSDLLHDDICKICIYVDISYVDVDRYALY